MHKLKSQTMVRIADIMKGAALILILFNFSFIFAQDKWENPIITQGRLGSPLVETHPFVFNERLYLVEREKHSNKLTIYQPIE